MPSEHRQYLEWTPQRIKLWGQKIGPYTKILMEEIMNRRAHPEHGFRGCLGIIRLSKTYSPERVESACKRALEIGAYNYKSVKSLLQTGLDSSAMDVENKKIVLLHDNIRGNEYYREASHD
jgi:transposase